MHPDACVSSKDEEEKPPLGVTPRKIFEQGRIFDLARAINEHVQQGYLSEEYINLIQSWSIELTNRLEEIRA